MELPLQLLCVLAVLASLKVVVGSEAGAKACGLATLEASLY